MLPYLPGAKQSGFQLIDRSFYNVCVAVNVIDALVRTVVVPINLIATVIIAVKGDPEVVVAVLVQVGLAAQFINEPVVPEDNVPDVTVAFAS